jgi:hypothetical protein
MSTKEGDVREVLAFAEPLSRDDARVGLAYAARILAYAALKHGLIAEIGADLVALRKDMAGEFGEAGVQALDESFLWLVRDGLRHIEGVAS